MPLSESRELDERPETEDTDDAVETERSSRGIAFIASDGDTQDAGEEGRSVGEGDDVSSMVAARCWQEKGV
jgi:hypothetical protein